MQQDLQHKYHGTGRQVFFKSYSSPQIDVDENSREVQGYIAAFDNRDEDGDVILKGAFQKSINERGPQSSTARKIAYLWNHDTGQPVGVFTDLWEDSKGLAFKGVLDDTQIGRDTLTRYKSGSVNNHSIGHFYVWDKIDVEKDAKGAKTFYLKEVNVFEGSALPLGANENTPYTGKKGMALHDAGVVLDHETKLFLKRLGPELEYEARKIITRHIALAEAKPLEALREEAEPQIKSRFGSLGSKL